MTHGVTGEVGDGTLRQVAEDAGPRWRRASGLGARTSRLKQDHRVGEQGPDGAELPGHARQRAAAR